MLTNKSKKIFKGGNAQVYKNRNSKVVEETVRCYNVQS